MVELATMGGSALLGFVFKLIANNQENKAEQQRMLLQKLQVENHNHNEASKRGGIWMQRFTVLVLISLFAIISLGAPDQSTNIVTEHAPREILFGLFSYEVDPTITKVDGMLYTNTLTLAVLNILSYLFGSQTAER
jgi:hypothetical protein